MDTVLALDQQLFFLLNHLPHNALLDGLALTLSGIGKAGFIWFVLGVWLFLQEEKRHPRFFAPLLAVGFGSWFLVEVFLKPFVSRIRPSIELGAIVVGNGSDSFSFPSGHATIAFAMAVVLSSVEPKWRWWFYGLAIAISFTRVYLGVHHPLDVLFGGILGWSIGKISVKSFVSIRK